jgi:hypothetical protein
MMAENAHYSVASREIGNLFMFLTVTNLCICLDGTLNMQLLIVVGGSHYMTGS